MTFFIFLLLSIFSLEGKEERFIKQFDQVAATERQAWNIPGMSIAIVKGEETLLEKGYGQRGLNNTAPVDPDTLFQIGSLSKAFTSALVAIADDRKLLKWHDRVVDHLPTFRLYDPWVTQAFQVIDLLAQRSGLPAYGGDSQAFLGFSEDAILDHLKYIQPVTSFRSAYAYQNSFFIVAAKILELKMKATYPQLLQREIFNPLGMKRTSASLEKYLQDKNRAEWLMRLDNGETQVLKDNYPSNNWNYILGPAGGINSSAHDMALWLKFQANQGLVQQQQLISRANMQLMTQPQISVGEKEGFPSMYYALGWVHMAYSPYPIIWHDGSTLGVFNVAAFIPEEKLGIVILTNVRNTQLAIALALQFFDLYYGKSDKNWSQYFLNKVKKVSPESHTAAYPAMSLSNYTGTYTNPIYGKADIKEDGQNLKLVFAIKPEQEIPLIHWDRDIFKLQWLGVDEALSKVSFLLDTEGKVSKMDIDAFAKEGGGDFTKLSVDQK